MKSWVLVVVGVSFFLVAGVWDGSSDFLLCYWVFVLRLMKVDMNIGI